MRAFRGNVTGDASACAHRQSWERWQRGSTRRRGGCASSCMRAQGSRPGKGEESAAAATARSHTDSMPGVHAQRGSSGAGDRSSVPGEGSSRALTQEPVSEPVCRATVVTVPGRFRSLTSDGQRQPTARPLPPAVSDESADLPPMLQAVLSRQVHTKRTGPADSETSQTSRARTKRRQWANATEWFRSLLPQASSQGATTWSWQSRSRNSVTSSRSMPWLSKSVPSADCVHAQAPWWRRRQSLARSLVPRRTTARWMSGRSCLSFFSLRSRLSPFSPSLFPRPPPTPRRKKG